MDLAEILYTSMIRYENEHLSIVPNEREEPDLFPPSQNENVLDIALYTLNLLPKESLGVVLYLTDGVSSDFASADLHDVRRTFLRDYIHFCVIQIGSSLGFTPTCNLGFVPNQEDLRYLAAALDGLVYYAEDCPYYEEEEIPKGLNVYHELLAMKLSQFIDPFMEQTKKGFPKSVDLVQTRYINTSTESHIDIPEKELDFPWKYDSQAPCVAEILCSYRNYKIPPLYIERLIHTRLNEGFTLAKLSSSKSSKDFFKIEIRMSLVFGQNITILYTIKFHWQQDSVSMRLFIPKKSIRVELNVLAHHSFAVLFINIHNVDNKTAAIGSGMYEKLGRLHEFLKGITESDETLQILAQFNSEAALQLAKQIGGELVVSVQPLDLPNNYWQYLHQVLLIKRDLLDCWSTNILLRSTSSQVNLGLRAAQSILGATDTSSRTRYQVATIYLSKFLNSWTSFNLGKTTYIRWVAPKEKMDQPSGFCLVQITWETESLMNIDLRFFACSLEEELAIRSEFQQGIHSIRHTVRNTTTMIEPIMLCTKPANSLLISYTPVPDINDETEDFRKHNDPVNLLFIANGTLARLLLSHKSWVWFGDIDHEASTGLFELIESSFVSLYNKRNREGYLRIAEAPGSVTFYKEIYLDGNISCAVQYVLLWCPAKNFLLTEVWMEPVRGISPKDTNYFEEFCADAFEMDLKLLSRLFAFQYALPKNHFLQRYRMNIPSIHFVETRLYLEPLLDASVFVYSPFKCLHYNPEVHQRLTESAMETIEILPKPCKITEDCKITEESGLRLDEVIESTQRLKFITDNCLVQEKDFALQGILKHNAILFGYFLSGLKEFCDRWLLWNKEKVGEIILDQVQNVVDSNVIRLPSLENSLVFIKSVNSKLYVIIVGELEADDLLTSLIIECEPSATDVELPIHLQKVTIHISGNIFSNDGSQWIEAWPVSKMESRSTSPLQNIQLLFDGGTSGPESDMQDADRALVQENVSQIFFDALCKAMYYSFLSNAPVLNFDFDRSTVRLKTKDFSVDLSYFMYLYKMHSEEEARNLKCEFQRKYLEILSQTFQFTNQFLIEPDVGNYFYFVEREEQTYDLIRKAQSPLFLTCNIIDRETMLSSGSGVPESIFEQKTSVDLSKQFSSGDQSTKFLFRVHALQSSRGALIINEDQEKRLLKFQARIETYINDLVLQSLLTNDVLKIDENVVHQVEKLLDKNYNFFQELQELGYCSCRIGWKASFLDLSCSEHFREDLSRFQVFGHPFCSYANRYYLAYQETSKKDQSFWVILKLEEGQVNLDFFCTSTDHDYRAKVLQECTRSLELCCFRANQRYLLRELADTHIAREDPPPSADTGLTLSYEDDILYKYGCGIQYSYFIPVHWRLRPVQVLNGILSALQAIAVTNRKGVLVYSEQYYIRMDTRGEEVDKSTRSLSDSNVSERQERGLFLSVCGLDPVGEDVTVGFVNMITTRVESMLQNVLGTFIARNPTARITKSDLDFVMSTESTAPCNQHLTYLLVPELENPHLFIVLLRQAFMLFLKPLVGNDLLSKLVDFYRRNYDQNISPIRERNPHNQLQVGDLSFIFNSVPTRYPTSLELEVGFGIIPVILTPFDRNNRILFPSTASATLWNNHSVVLDENCYKVKSSTDVDEIHNWNGFKIAVSIWAKGNVNLEPILARIDSAFQHTLVDYTIESYYRSSKWHTLAVKKSLPDFPSPHHPFQTGKHQPEFVNVLDTLPAILETGSERKNPVIQSIRVNGSLPLESIVRGVRSIFTDDEIQAYFFSHEKEVLSLIDTLPEIEQRYSRNYIVIGASDIYSPPKATDRRMSTISDESSTSSLSPRLGTMKLARNTSAESVSDSDSIERERRNSGGKLGSGFDFEEIFMFPDTFYPPFPLYGKRSSFFMVCLFRDHISVSTYNWKKSESDKFFLKIIKILNWAKINDQFLTRKEMYTGKELIHFSSNLSEFGSFAYSSAAISPSGTFMSKARELDFLYHIGGFDAVHLQTQIVDFLELFFRFGKQPVKANHITYRETEDSTSPLSLLEMSRVLQSITLIHSSSSPIFFSSCCNDLMTKWTLLSQSTKMTKANLLNLAQTITSSGYSTSKNNGPEAIWFKDMIGQYQEKYIEYLEHLGMEKTRYDFSSNETGIFGGGLMIKEDEMIDAPSLFLRKFFPNKVILVQCGFYSYFATVNVLTFDYTSPDGKVSTTDDFGRESSSMIQYSHIVSFSYDFHLRYIKDILMKQDQIDLPIHLGQVLNVFTTLNPRKARFARNRIGRGSLQWVDETADLFRYIMKHPESYGYQSFFCKGIVTGICITLDRLNPRSAESSDFVYTLVVCEGNQDGDATFRLDYFIIIVDKNHTFPHKELENGIDVAKQVDQDPMAEYISSGYYLRDIVSNCEQRIQSLVEQALTDFGRDNLWYQLREASSTTRFEWSNLFLEKISPNLRDAALIDSGLADLLQTKLPWQNIINYLLQTHQKYARPLETNQSSTTHLILFNPHNSDYLLYLKWTREPNETMQMLTASRSGIRDSVEYDHINDIVNSILYFLWSL